MREGLQALEGQRLIFTGTFTRFGCKPLFGDLYLETILLEDVRLEDGTMCAQHVWLASGAKLSRLELHAGDTLSFEARVRPYTKRNIYQRRNGRIKRIRKTLDYTLAYPSRIVHTPLAH